MFRKLVPIFLATAGLCMSGMAHDGPERGDFAEMPEPLRLIPNGILRIDLNADGIEDLVISARQEWHGPRFIDELSFFVTYKRNYEVSHEGKEYLVTVPFYGDDANELKGPIRNFGTPDCHLDHHYLVRGGGRIFVVAAVRALEMNVGWNYGLEEPVDLTFFELRHNVERAESMPPFRFVPSRRHRLSERYCDVNEGIVAEITSVRAFIADAITATAPMIENDRVP